MEPLLHSDFLTKTLGEDALHTLKCSICLDYFEDPVILLCGHTFCRNCIQDTANYTIRQQTALPSHKVSLYCPECRRSCNASQIVKKGSKVPINYPIASLLNTLQNRTTPIKVDASTHTAVGCKTKGTQSSVSSVQTQPELKYDVTQLDELENSILKLCRPESNADNCKSNSASLCKDTFENDGHPLVNEKPQNRVKLLKCKNEYLFEKRNAPNASRTIFTNTCTFKSRFPRKTSNISDLTTDPDVLRYYNSLS